ncbi:MAG: hypothetical protein KDK71_02610, partial [Chlamydiia bacterium]|nr:hypothetical protein [Chlamydiia bacterium]
IIGIIASVVGYNMRGSLDKGKAFKTKEGMRKLYDIVQLEMEPGKLGGKDSDALRAEVAQLVRNSGLVKNVDDLLKDGWGNSYTCELENDDIRFTSQRYIDYCTRQGMQIEYPWNADTNSPS